VSALRVLIVGGGITGLSAAYYLERLAADAGISLEVTLVESDIRLGGKLGTVRQDRFLVDIGPDSFMAQKPWALELCNEIGLGDEIISPLSSQFYMYTDGKLHTVPHELVSLVPSKPEALWKTSFLSLAAKTRASGEALVKPRGDLEDESLSSFMRRRFGDEFAAHFAEPLMGGVHAGNPERMSMAAIYPMFWEMEKKHGSITRALLERRLRDQPNVVARSGSPFVALKHGMQSLIDRLSGILVRTRFLFGDSVTRLAPSGSGQYIVALESGQEFDVDAIILASPAYIASTLIQPFSSEAAKTLEAIPYASTALVTLAYRREDIENPLEGTGFLVPRDQGLSIAGCTWSSNKWDGRAPEGLVLMRAFMGYAGNDELIRNRTEDQLHGAANQELSGILGIRAAPIFTRVDRWLNAMPQYEVGHLGRVDQVEKELSGYPGLLLAGSAYRGVGVPDCVRQGKEVAEKAMHCSRGDQ
jgi:oxygen-dependent protoporphyrinogen oxidase